jgi:hypothetical protein
MANMGSLRRVAALENGKLRTNPLRHVAVDLR